MSRGYFIDYNRTSNVVDEIKEKIIWENIDHRYE